MSKTFSRFEILSAGVFISVLLQSCGPSANELQVSASDYGADWPLTVQSGTLKCVPSNAVIFEASNGVTYAINGNALARTDSEDWVDPRQAQVWKLDAEAAELGIEKNMDMVLLDTGLDLCEG